MVPSNNTRAFGFDKDGNDRIFIVQNYIFIKYTIQNPAAPKYNLCP
jgi:hypothetical protein